MDIAALILAAGGSRRMGVPKQILDWGNTTMLEHVIRTTRAAGISKLFVVLGADSEAIQKEIEMEGLILIQNPKWHQGLGSSISAGIQKLKTDASIQGCLILLSDQPFITSSYLMSMIDTFDGETLVASRYGDKAGVPCLFPCRHFSQLEQLKGDQGARKVLRKLHTEIIFPASIPDLRDIDTPEMYKLFSDQNGKF